MAILFKFQLLNSFVVLTINRDAITGFDGQGLSKK